MLSIPWKEAIKHQTNLSLTKETYAFSKDKRFKDKHSVLYFITNTDAIPFIISHHP